MKTYISLIVVLEPEQSSYDFLTPCSFPPKSATPGPPEGSAQLSPQSGNSVLPHSP